MATTEVELQIAFLRIIVNMSTRSRATIHLFVLLILIACVFPVVAEVQYRGSGFGYSVTSGVLTKEVVEPDLSGVGAGYGGRQAYCVVTEYAYTDEQGAARGYDAYGNKAGAKTRNCDGSAIGTGGV